MKKNSDYLDDLIDESVKDPKFATAWEPISFMLDLVSARVEQGLSQAEVAERMKIGRVRVTEMERNPSKVSFERILAYAQAVGVTLTIKHARSRTPGTQGPGRPVGGSAYLSKSKSS